MEEKPTLSTEYNPQPGYAKVSPFMFKCMSMYFELERKQNKNQKK